MINKNFLWGPTPSQVEYHRRTNVNPVNPGANYDTILSETQSTLFTRLTIEAKKVFDLNLNYKLEVRYEPKFSDLNDADLDIKHKIIIPLGKGFGIAYEHAR